MAVTWSREVAQVELKEFTDVEAREYLRSTLNEDDDDLARELGYLPFSLNQAVALIKTQRQQGKYEIADFLREHRANRALGMGPVLASLQLALPEIAASPHALKLLRCCAFLGTENIIPRIFADKDLLANMPNVFNALTVLASYSTISVRGKEFVMHQLMQEAVIQELKKHYQEEQADESIYDEYLNILANVLQDI
jgi:hypothetical protein